MPKPHEPSTFVSSSSNFAMEELITPCLWFNGKAREAAEQYRTTFTDAKIVAQSPIVTEIEISDQRITLLDGGAQFRPNPSISLFCICETEEEINGIWNAMSAEGNVLMPLDEYDWSPKYGWVNDQYGVSWQLSLGSIEDVGQKITPFLMFTGEQFGRAEKALTHYSAIFKDPKLDGILRYGPNEVPEQEGTVKHAQVALDGQRLMLMDSAQVHEFGFTEGVSLTIHCADQTDVDFYWQKLTECGEESMCGWLKDKFGVSWQVIPTMLSDIMNDPNKAEKAAKAFMGMRKIEIGKIVQAISE